MSRPAFVRGIGAVGPFGTGREAFRQAVATGTWSGAPADTSPLDAYIPRRNQRRLDHQTMMALLAAQTALNDAGLADPADRRELGILLGSGYGAMATTFALLDTTFDDGDPCSSPTLFSHSVHNAAVASLSIHLGITGPCLTVGNLAFPVHSALATALSWLAEERVGSLLLGGLDERHPVLDHCRERFFGPEEAGAGIEPFALDRQTARAGEGAAFLLLSPVGAPGGAAVTRVLFGGPDDALGCPREAVVLAGLDGHAACGAHYRRLIPPGARVFAVSPGFGDFPAAPVFDLAAALLSAASGEILAPPPSPGDHPWRVVPAGEPLDGRPIWVLKTDRRGAWAAAVVERA
jgi:3-oxoacyl-[acyl-carrier-protein] synthase II